VAPSYALNGRPYIIHFFIGEAPSGPITDALLHSSKSYLGSVFTFSSTLEPEGNTVACHNCRKQQQSGLLSTGQVPVSTALLTHAKDENIPGLQSLDPLAVAVYLEQKLTWVAAEVWLQILISNLDFIFTISLSVYLSAL
jgi:hypothetical protein